MSDNVYEEPIHIEVEETLPTKTFSNDIVKMSVIGVGGGGCNMIDYMVDKGISKIDLIAANTDKQSLDSSKAPKKIQLGIETTKGLGAGMKPEVGKEAAEESYEEIKEVLYGANMVFVASGLGGGTGSGAAAVVAKAAKEIGALTVSVVTRPFSWEGKRRAHLAAIGLEELRKNSDSTIIIHNDKLIDSIDDSMGLSDSFKIVDEVLYQAVNGISGVILSKGYINTDFADITTVMQHKGLALMGIEQSKGEESLNEALEQAVSSPLLDNISLSGAKGMLIYLEIHPSIPFSKVNAVMTKVNENTDEETTVVFGLTDNNSYDLDEVKITIVATGFNLSDNNTVADKNKPKVVKTNNNDLDSPTLGREYVIQYEL